MSASESDPEYYAMVWDRMQKMLRDRARAPLDETSAVHERGALHSERLSVYPGRIVIFMSAAEKIGVTIMRRLEVLCIDHRADHLLILVRNKITPFANAVLQRSTDVRKFEIFRFSFFLKKVASHSYVPKHRLLSPGEASAVIERYGGDPSVLPKLCSEDVFVRYYGMEPGDVAEFTRIVNALETVSMYRIVVR